MKFVDLTNDEIKTANAISEARQNFAEVNKSHGVYGASNDRNSALEMHNQGVVSEMAVCKYYNVYWQPNFTVRGVIDICGKFEVRSTDYEKGRLITHNPPKDKADYPYLLVKLHLLPRVILVGYEYGKDTWKIGSWEIHRKNGGAWYTNPKKDPDDLIRIVRQINGIEGF
jgi:hypothetical protein